MIQSFEEQLITSLYLAAAIPLENLNSDFFLIR